jgi:hypothetical protein
MMTDAEIAVMHRRMIEIFGSRQGHLLWQLEHYAKTMQRFDVTFYNREPLLDVTLGRDFARKYTGAFLYDRGVEYFKELLKRVTFSDGTTVPAGDIWTMNYMPDEGISIKELDGADIGEAEAKIGLGGETARLMLRKTYRCCSAAEEDWFVRRWIAS